MKAVAIHSRIGHILVAVHLELHRLTIFLANAVATVRQDTDVLLLLLLLISRLLSSAELHCTGRAWRALDCI